MSHAITLGDLLLTLGLIGGLGTMAMGALNAFANGMADAQGDGGKQGCAIFVCGLIVLIGCLIGLIS